MTYRVPRYTEISHFRAPYKDSMMGFGAAGSDSRASATSTLVGPVPSGLSLPSGTKSTKPGPAPKGLSFLTPSGSQKPVKIPATAKGKAEKIADDLIEYLYDLARKNVGASYVSPSSSAFQSVTLKGLGGAPFPPLPGGGAPSPSFTAPTGSGSQLAPRTLPSSKMSALAVNPKSPWRLAVTQKLAQVAQAEGKPAAEKIASLIVAKLRGLKGFAFSARVNGTALDPLVQSMGPEQYVTKRPGLARENYELAALPAAAKPKFELPGMAMLGGSKQAGSASVLDVPPAGALGATPAPGAAPVQTSTRVLARAKSMPIVYRTRQDAEALTFACLDSPTDLLNLTNRFEPGVGQYSAKGATPCLPVAQFRAEVSAEVQRLANKVSKIEAEINEQKKKFVGTGGQLKKVQKQFDQNQNDLAVTRNKLNQARRLLGSWDPNTVNAVAVFTDKTLAAVESGLKADVAAVQVAIKKEVSKSKFADIRFGKGTQSEAKKAVAEEAKSESEAQKAASKAADDLAKAQKENEDLKKAIEDLKALAAGAPPSPPGPSPFEVSAEQMAMTTQADAGVAAAVQAAADAAAKAAAEQQTVAKEEPAIVEALKAEEEEEESMMEKYGVYIAGASLLGVLGYVVYKKQKK